MQMRLKSYHPAEAGFIKKCITNLNAYVVYLNNDGELQKIPLEILREALRRKDPL